MRMNRKPLLLVLLLLALVLYRCAQVIPLSGGPRDTIPPALLSVSPANKSTNLPTRGLTIVFKFNELIAAKNASQKLIINPQVEEMPEVSTNGKTLTVTFEKELQANTTYLLQFGNSVVDIHEGNPYPNLSYLFSTGPTLDSSYVTGKAVFALSGKPAPDMQVMLYKDLSDSAPMRGRPDYITRTDESGNYFLSAIKPGKYRLVAIADKNKNQQYDLSEAIGFASELVDVQDDTLDLKVSTADAGRLFVKKKLQPFWGYNKYVLSDTFPNAYIISEKALDTDRYEYETRSDTLEVYYRGIYDTRFTFVVKDGKQAFDTVSVQVPGRSEVDTSVARGTRKIGVRTEKSVYGSRHDEVVLSFSVPLEEVLADKCVLLMDSIAGPPRFTSEKANEEGNLVTTFHPLYKKRLASKLEPGHKYTLLILPGAVKTYWGTMNTDTLSVVFKTLPADEVSNLQVKLGLPGGIESYVLQLLNSKEQLVAARSGSRSDTHAVWFYNLAAGDYSLRLIDDEDQDQKFSPASYVNKQQPERVFFYEKKITLPAGWDVDAEWKLEGAGAK